MDGAGTISGRWSLAAGRAAIKGCRICHGPTLPGMRLCTQCKAALKRARQETVSELVPARAPAARAPRASKVAPEVEAAPARAPAARAPRASKAAPEVGVAPQGAGSNFGGARATAIVLSVVAAAGVGYAALRLARAVPATLPSPPVATAPAPAADPAPAARSEPTVPAAAPRERPTLFVAPASASQVVRPPAPKRAPEPAPPLPPEPPATARFAAATEPPAPQPAVAPVPLPAPAPDRWQLMTDAITRCGHEGFFAGVICEQRVRLQYCEGYWGQAPQCPSGIANDHGQ